jgi:glycoprotein-N-acetylgalactosamine 3-beta-galactosyltransferase
VPLRKECLDIVRRAGPPVDVAYEDVSGGHLGHPHRGATHEDGKTFGYVPDEAALHRGPPRFRLGGARLARACSQRDSHRKLLTEKVFVDLNATTTRQSEDGPGGPGTSPVRILCLVYTVEQHHSRLPAIRETWGYVCSMVLLVTKGCQFICVAA